MKPSETEMRQLKEMDIRLTRFKESEWQRLGHPDPEGMAIMCIIFSIPLLGQALLILGLLHEILSKYLRMLVIAVKAGYLHTRFWIIETVDRTETKLFDIWRKMI